MVSSNRAKGIPEDDSFWDDVADVATNFGYKFKFGTNEKKGEITRFVGEFRGTREVPNQDNPEELMQAAEFVDTEGRKCYCWQLTQLREAIRTGDIQYGDTVRITLTGEQETSRGLNPVKTFEIKVKR